MQVDYLKQGDCLELMKDIPDGSIDMILADLPFGTTRNQWDKIIPFDLLWSEYNRIIKDNGAIVLFSQLPFTAKLVMSNQRFFRYEWIWQKTKCSGFMNAKKMPLKQHENILVFYKKLPTYNPQGIKKGVSIKTGRSRKGNSRNYGKTGCGNPDYIQTVSNYPKDILCFSNPSNKRHLHPNQKPVDLLEYLVKTYTNPGDVVLDNCMGSGSTCVAAVNTNRHYIGFELDEQYFNIAQERILKAQQGKYATTSDWLDALLEV